MDLHSTSSPHCPPPVPSPDAPEPPAAGWNAVVLHVLFHGGNSWEHPHTPDRSIGCWIPGIDRCASLSKRIEESTHHAAGLSCAMWVHPCRRRYPGPPQPFCPGPRAPGRRMRPRAAKRKSETLTVRDDAQSHHDPDPQSLVTRPRTRLCHRSVPLRSE